jgi:hypothetical protein
MNGIPDLRRRDLLKAAGAAAALSVLPLAGPVASAQNHKMRIGMIGSGNVGSALGRVWAKAGYEVMFSSRNLDSDQKLAAEVGANARAGTPQEAAAFERSSCSQFLTARCRSSARPLQIRSRAR